MYDESFFMMSLNDTWNSPQNLSELKSYDESCSELSILLQSSEVFWVWVSPSMWNSNLVGIKLSKIDLRWERCSDNDSCELGVLNLSISP